jgi:hypothetical protein
MTGATFLAFETDWMPRLLRPTSWKPYNLSPTAKIRETIRPHFESQGIILGTRQTTLQAILMSVLLLAGFVLVVGGIFAILQEI